MDVKKEIYCIGQKLIFREDTKQIKGFGSEVMIKKGTPVFVGADRRMPFAHYLNGDIQKIGDDVEVKGYSVTGLAEWLYEYVSREIPLDDMLEDYDETKERFMDVVADALEELGMYDNTGNRM